MPGLQTIRVNHTMTVLTVFSNRMQSAPAQKGDVKECPTTLTVDCLWRKPTGNFRAPRQKI